MGTSGVNGLSFKYDSSISISPACTNHVSTDDFNPSSGRGLSSSDTQGNQEAYGALVMMSFSETIWLAGPRASSMPRGTYYFPLCSSTNFL